jgi:hypothetical protein
MMRDRLSFDWRAVAVAAGSFLLVGGLSAANGGYFPASWGWAAMAAFWLAIVALVLSSEVRMTRLEAAFAVAVAAFSSWTFASALWASSVTRAMLEGERSLVLVGAVAAAIAIGVRGGTRLLLGGALGGITLICVYSLLTRLLPDRLGSFDPGRLNTPIGYWNGLGLFADMGALVALGFAARGTHAITRAASAATLVVLLPTVYFTFSRGSWIALGAGLALALLADQRRLETAAALLALAPLPALAVFLASRQSGLTDQGATLAEARHAGAHLLLWLTLLAGSQVLVAIAYGEATRRLHPTPVVRRGFAVLLGVLVVAVAVGGIARYGSPWHLAHRGYNSFTASPPASRSTNLNTRLFSLSGNGRWQLWQVAGKEVRAHPIFGGGAGSYEAEWNQYRPFASKVRDAHNLYLETLAELGVVGLVLLVVVLGIPLVAAFRRRHHPLVPFALGAYSAYLAHAVVDWDWELAGVTVAAFLIGLACLRPDRQTGDFGAEIRIGRRGALASAAALAVVGAFAVLTLVSNTAATQADAAVSAGNWKSAARHARQVIRWAPWSSRGWQQLGEAQLAQGQSAAARRSFTKAAGKDPRDWSIWLELATAETGAQRRAALQTAKGLNPLSPQIAQFITLIR